MYIYKCVHMLECVKNVYVDVMCGKKSGIMHVNDIDQCRVSRPLPPFPSPSPPFPSHFNPLSSPSLSII